MTTAHGIIENISTSEVFIFGLGWKLPVGYSELITTDNVIPQALRQSTDELEALVVAGKIKLRTPTGIPVIAGGVSAWIATSPSVPGNGVGGTILNINGHLAHGVEKSGSISFFDVIHHISCDQVGQYLPFTATLLRSDLVVNRPADSGRDYEFALYHDPSGTPVKVEGTSSTLLSTEKSVFRTDYSGITLSPGSYGLALDRVVGGEGRASFDKVIGNFWVQIQ